MVALASLVNTSAGDLRIQFQHFSGALDELVASQKRTDGMGGRLDRKSAAYFKAWGRQLLAINDEDLRKRSEARKVEVSNEYQTTRRHYQETQDALAPLVDYLLDLRKALSADLTMAGLQAAKPPFNNASERAAKVQRQLTQSAAELDTLGAKMSSFAAQGAQ